MFGAFIAALNRNTAAHDRNTDALRLVANRLGKLMPALDNLTSAVQQETTVEASAVALINGLGQELKAAVADNDSGRIQALADQITASSSALAAAVTANTSAAPNAAGNQISTDPVAQPGAAPQPGTTGV